MGLGKGKGWGTGKYRHKGKGKGQDDPLTPSRKSRWRISGTCNSGKNQVAMVFFVFPKSRNSMNFSDNYYFGGLEFGQQKVMRKTKNKEQVTIE